MLPIKKIGRRNLIVLCLLLFVAILIYLLVFNKPKSNGIIPSSTNPQSANPTPSQSTPKNSSSSAPSSNSDSKFPTPAQDNNAVLLPPSGTFVSNHRPSLSGDAHQLEEQSVCSSNAGASCFIRFTQGSIVKTLTAQTIGSTGTTYWSWSIKDSGLTEGTWAVEAVATLNGQEKISKDSVDLVINK